MKWSIALRMKYADNELELEVLGTLLLTLVTFVGIGFAAWELLVKLM